MSYLATLGFETIFPGADIPFNSNETLNGAIHLPGTAAITFNESGDYQVDYTINSINPFIGSEVAITVNDVPVKTTLLTIPGEVTDTAQLTLVAGDVITLRNNSSFRLTLALAPKVGAKMDIKKN